MAKHKIVWIDDDGGEHTDEEAADRANVRIKAEKVLFPSGFPCSELKRLDGMNHQTLEPLKEYIDLLMRESMERTKKYG